MVQDINDAMHYYRSTPGASKCKSAKRFGIEESTLRFRIAKDCANKELGKAGRKFVFSQEVEKELAECITVASMCGFSPSMEEVRVSAHFVSQTLFHFLIYIDD